MRRKHIYHPRGFWRELRAFSHAFGFDKLVRKGQPVYIHGRIGGYSVFTATPKRKRVEMREDERTVFMKFSQKVVTRRRELEHMRLEEHKHRRQEDQ